jgi:hypothetical protein
MERNVFTYWTGVKPFLIDFLLDLIKLHSDDGKNYKFILLTPENVKDWIDVPDKVFTLIPAHQADYIRVNVIMKYGGIWVDADTLVMGSMKEVFDIIENRGAFYLQENNNVIANGFFGSIKNHEVITKIKIEIDEFLKIDKNLKWTSIGSCIFNPIVMKHQNDVLILKGLDTVYPVNWDYAEKQFLRTPYDNYKKIIRHFQPVIILVNSVYKKFKIETFYKQVNPLNYFIRKSLINATFYDYQFYFEMIYKYKLWNDDNPNIPLSGPGASKSNTVDVSKFINYIIDKYKIQSVVDLGCGDLTWISTTKAFDKNYIGIDVYPSLIQSNQVKYNKTFMCKNIINDELPSGDLFIVRDVIFLLSNKNVANLLDNIKGKYKYLIIGSNVNDNNSDMLNCYHYSEKNLFINPFSKSFENVIERIFESKNNRDLLLCNENF